MRFALPATALAAAILVPAWGQPVSAPPPPTSSAVAPVPATASAVTASAVPAPVAAPPATPLPPRVVVELQGPPAAQGTSGGLVAGTITAVIAALGALAVAAYNGWRMGSTERMKADTARDMEIVKGQAAEHLLHLEQAFGAAQEEARQISERAKAESALAHDRQKDEANRLLQTGQHQDKIALEMQALQLRANVSDTEAYMAVKRLQHERDLAQANLVNTFFGKLLSESQRERDLALFAISAFVDPERLAMLAAGGEAIVSRESLSRLAARGTTGWPTWRRRC
jgi:hypothetical protein